MTITHQGAPRELARVTLIGPARGWLDVPWRELWERRELFFMLAGRDLRIRYKQTIMGVLWSVLQPLLSTAVFTVFFGRLAKLPTDGLPYPVFALAGLTLWTLFSNALTSSTNSLVANASLLNKVYFPRLLLPASAVLVAIVDSLVGSCMLLLVMLIAGVPVHVEMLLFVPLLGLVALLAFGLGLTLSNANARYRDVRHAIPIALQLTMFMSPIIYPSSLVPERWRPLYALNPLAGAIDSARALAAHRTLPWNMLGTSLLVIMLVLIVGLALFRRGEQDLVDTV